MEPRLSLISLGVADLAATHRFYVDGLGWPAALYVPGEVLFVQIGHGLLLSLWDLDHMVAEVGPVGSGPAPVTLAQNLSSETEVTEALAAAVAAGGTLLVPGARRDWGGFSGYVADPDGYRWEIAHNPGLRVDDDGTVHIGPVDG
ncbi:VOC family protein [Nakamurella deserti]|uniref:VOC family protein n=1 Tax=Nakamurella deserti TaxID=2164074 RepID=UPI000DBE3D28|nr:VOC family protein [Nakamurella deserti]